MTTISSDRVTLRLTEEVLDVFYQVMLTNFYERRGVGAGNHAPLGKEDEGMDEEANMRDTITPSVETSAIWKAYLESYLIESLLFVDFEEISIFFRLKDLPKQETHEKVTDDKSAMEPTVETSSLADSTFSLIFQDLEILQKHQTDSTKNLYFVVRNGKLKNHQKDCEIFSFPQVDFFFSSHVPFFHWLFIIFTLYIQETNDLKRTYFSMESNKLQGTNCSLFLSDSTVCSLCCFLSFFPSPDSLFSIFISLLYIDTLAR